MTTATATSVIDSDNYETKFGFHDDELAFFKSNKGLTEDVVNMISDMKDEPQWMREFRLKSLGSILQDGEPFLGLATVERAGLRQYPLLRARHRPR